MEQRPNPLKSLMTAAFFWLLWDMIAHLSG
jgi:hypothetical protein